ncbi:MAG: thioredoxin [Candidatus Dojkabacteria bacterium]|jgi:thioredoxin 1
MKEVLHLTGDTFQKEILDYEGVALVDFWAPWCGPCQMVGPVIEELAGEFDNAKICKVNVDEEGLLAQQYEIMSIPAVYIFKNGEVQETIIGAQAKDTYKEAIQKYI